MDSTTAPTGNSSSTNPKGSEPVNPKPSIPQAPVRISGSGGKEVESGLVGLGSFEIPDLTEIGKDIELPKEVERAGVKVTPTVATVPPALRNIGVKATGQSAQTTAVQPQTVPLNDDQISQGLKQSLTSSWHWLAEWCVRKLKQLKRVVKK